MAWMKIDLELPDKPEVHAIAGMLNLDPDAVVGKLIRVWQWFDKHTTDGNASVIGNAFVDRIAATTGFADSMVKVGWLHVTESGIAVPNFDKHNGETAKKRAETARRVAKHRDVKKPEKCNDDVTRNTLPRPLVRNIKERDENTCVYCGRPEGEYTPPEVASDAVIQIDHVIPVSRGGTDDENNLVCACAPCNNFKNDRTPDECGMKWPTDENGNRFGVTKSVPREREREDKNKAIRKAYTCEKFAEFWKLWPATDRRTNKAKCLDKWKTLGLDEHASEIFPHVAALKLTQKWREGFEPAPLTYLNGRQWEDDLPTVQRQQSTGQTGQARERARVAAQIFGNGSYQENKELDITGFSERVE